jgi:outer membrane lipoprotein-sorting protein
MTMVVRTERYERTLSLEAWSEGKEKSLVVIRAPKKDEGVATLKVEQNIWNFLPKINRVTKIPPSLMMGSWMGSHFTNDDLVKDSTFVDDYDAEMTFRGERDGRRLYEVTLLPKPDAPVVWGKVVMDIEQGTLIPLKADFYDEDQELARTMIYSQPKPMSGRLVPQRMELRPHDKPGESTVIMYDSLEFDVKLPKDLFSLQRLQSVR